MKLIGFNVEDPDCEYTTKHDASDVGDCVVENV